MAESQGTAPLNGGQDTDASGASGDEEGKKPLSFASEEEFNAHVNRAFANRLRDFERSFSNKTAKQLTDLSASLIGQVGATLDEKLTALLSAQAEQKAAAQTDAEAKEAAKRDAATKGAEGRTAETRVEPPKPPDFKVAESPEFKKLQADAEANRKQLEKLQNEAKEAAKRENEAKAKARDGYLRSTLADALGKIGVPADRLKRATDNLVLIDRSVRFESDESDTLVFVVGDEQFPLDKGLTAWGKTHDAKIFFPPVNPGGSGGGPGGKPPGNSATNTQDAELKDGINRLILGRPE